MEPRQKGTKYYSMANSARKRPAVKLSLSPEARDALDMLAKLSGLSMSKVVDLLALSKEAKKIVMGT